MFRGVRCFVSHFQDKGWVIDFIVQPRADFPDLGQPIVDWCAERGIVMQESRIEVANVDRREFYAWVSENEAMEYKLRWR